MSLYFGCLSVSFMTLIHAFWFVALAVADRIAIWPLLPICLAMDSTWFSPTSFVVTWLTNTLRASGATSESIPTILIPFCAACLRAGATALGSLPAMMIAVGFCWAIELMSGTCDDAPASVEPWMRSLPPSSLAASTTPECSNSSYGLPSCFGIDTIFRPFGIGADGLAPASAFEDAWVEPPEFELESFLGEPHAAATRASAATSTDASSRR